MSAPQLRDEDFQTLERYMADFEDKESALIKVLYEAQSIFGYLPKEVVLFIADKLGVPASKIYGVISFYSYFTTEPKGRCEIKVCMGTACFVCGAEKVARELESTLRVQLGQTTPDFNFSLESVRCVGACGLAPAVVVDGEVHARMTPSDVKGIIERKQSAGGKG